MLGAGSVYFDTTVFAGSNPAANTIFPNIVAYNALIVSSNTTIQGLTSGSGATLTNLVTVDGGGSGVANNEPSSWHPERTRDQQPEHQQRLCLERRQRRSDLQHHVAHGLRQYIHREPGHGSGGGIFNGFGGTLTVVNSTFSSNSL